MTEELFTQIDILKDELREVERQRDELLDVMISIASTYICKSTDFEGFLNHVCETAQKALDNYHKETSI